MKRRYNKKFRLNQNKIYLNKIRYSEFPKFKFKPKLVKYHVFIHPIYGRTVRKKPYVIRWRARGIGKNFQRMDAIGNKKGSWRIILPPHTYIKKKHLKRRNLVYKYNRNYKKRTQWFLRKEHWHYYITARDGYFKLYMKFVNYFEINLRHGWLDYDVRHEYNFNWLHLRFIIFMLTIFPIMFIYRFIQWFLARYAKHIRRNKIIYVMYFWLAYIWVKVFFFFLIMLGDPVWGGLIKGS